MRKKLLIALSVLIFLIIAGVVAEFVLTSQAESQLASIVQKKLNLSRPPEVKITAHPLLFKLYQGQIDYIQISADNVIYDKFNADQIVVTIKNLEFDSSLLLSRRELLVEKVDAGLLKIVISEAEVNKYAQGILPGSRIKLEKGRLRYLGKVSYFGQEIDLNLVGRIGIDPAGTSLSFFPDEASLNSLPVPSAARDYIAAAVSTELTLPDLPINVKLVGVEIEPDRLIIKGQITDFGLLKQRS